MDGLAHPLAFLREGKVSFAESEEAPLGIVAVYHCEIYIPHIVKVAGENRRKCRFAGSTFLSGHGNIKWFCHSLRN